jgi:hypothetical protein
LQTKVKVFEDYLEYKPPVQLYRTMDLLLRYVPQQHLEDLRKIILTDSAYLRKTIRGRMTQDKKRFRPADCRGLYYRDGQIVLVVDQIFLEYPEVLLLIPFFKAMAIGETLYHEIGHHIDRKERPGYRDNREAVADDWSEKLLKQFLQKRYWYIRGICALLLRLQNRFWGLRKSDECLES